MAAYTVCVNTATGLWHHSFDAHSLSLEMGNHLVFRDELGDIKFHTPLDQVLSCYVDNVDALYSLGE